eukprot:CAMPEP_0194478424 /NCGR_PEP_ID=MMETSP0253-20130528/1870_1 /TAXON_ID=2966 /ORGANISM="Noctiluca scintillans" /LENGTH=202 /DNA_ID=CAMNT_0039317507 /DNA_START=109 /DNA_END=718 /DNA_ORIENTATION=+
MRTTATNFSEGLRGNASRSKPQAVASLPRTALSPQRVSMCYTPTSAKQPRDYLTPTPPSRQRYGDSVPSTPTAPPRLSWASCPPVRGSCRLRESLPMYYGTDIPLHHCVSDGFPSDAFSLHTVQRNTLLREPAPRRLAENYPERSRWHGVIDEADLRKWAKDGARTNSMKELPIASQKPSENAWLAFSNEDHSKSTRLSPTV